MCVNPWNNWLNTIAVRASYILPDFLGENQEKPGVVYLPPENAKTEMLCIRVRYITGGPSSRLEKKPTMNS